MVILKQLQKPRPERLYTSVRQSPVFEPHRGREPTFHWLSDGAADRGGGAVNAFLTAIIVALIDALAKITVAAIARLPRHARKH